MYLFADESGNFDFSRGRGASRYFILTTVTLADTVPGDALLALRRELAWNGVGLDTESTPRPTRRQCGTASSRCSRDTPSACTPR